MSEAEQKTYSVIRNASSGEDNATVVVAECHLWSASKRVDPI